MLVSVMNELKLGLHKNGIVLMGLNTGNIFIQENCGRHVGRIVDNIGSASFLPLEYYFGYFARARLRRRWKRFMEKILADYQDDRVAKLVRAIR